MLSEGWRIRLEEAARASGKSANAISAAAGLAPNYLHGVLKQGKEPTVERLLRLCEAIPASPIYILHGHDVQPEDEKILRLLRDNPRARAGILAILASAAEGE